MKNILKCSVVALALAIGSGLGVQAQTTQPEQSAPHHSRGQHHADPARETKMLTKRLSLTPEQASQVEPILADREQRMEALKPAAGTQPDFKAMRSQRQAIMQDTKAKLDAVLTDTQKQELEQMHHGHGRHGNWNGQQPQTAPPAATL